MKTKGKGKLYLPVPLLVSDIVLGKRNDIQHLKFQTADSL